MVGLMLESRHHLEGTPHLIG